MISGQWARVPAVSVISASTSFYQYPAPRTRPRRRSHRARKRETESHYLGRGAGDKSTSTDDASTSHDRVEKTSKRSIAKRIRARYTPYIPQSAARQQGYSESGERTIHPQHLAQIGGHSIHPFNIPYSELSTEYSVCVRVNTCTPYSLNTLLRVLVRVRARISAQSTVARPSLSKGDP